jgi:hypothetical protein
MTKKLEELFNLDTIDSTNEAQDSNELLTPLVSQHTQLPQETLNNLDKIESALPAVIGLEASDSEMDELSKLAQDSYKDLMDLGMNVDSRFSAEIFSVASGLLGHAITAKTAKINKKLRMVDLQLKKAKLDKTANEGEQPLETGHGYILDRNELLKELLVRDKPKE